jgi:hypothetical protein
VTPFDVEHLARRRPTAATTVEHRVERLDARDANDGSAERSAGAAGVVPSDLDRYPVGGSVASQIQRRSIGFLHEMPVPLVHRDRVRFSQHPNRARSCVTRYVSFSTSQLPGLAASSLISHSQRMG